MIQAEFCSVVRLHRIFRQAAESQIVMNAHRINSGEEISLENASPDFMHLERKDSASVINVVVQLIMQKLPPHVDASPYDIQVLTPTRKGELGVEHLNQVLQQYMNPADAGKVEREFHGVLFREKDKVMQIKNDYQIRWTKKTSLGDVYEEGTGVFNGDTGIIREIIPVAEQVVVEFEEGKWWNMSIARWMKWNWLMQLRSINPKAASIRLLCFRCLVVQKCCWDATCYTLR